MHIIEAQQFDQAALIELFELADFMEKLCNNGNANFLARKIMATLFYEPSTRTRLSFEAAMIRLGGHVITTENASEFSSAAKGETLEDTIRVIHHYADVIVLRHKESGAARRASQVSTVPIINAGDGPGQHPTQALVDVYTIKRELRAFDGISIALVGDLANGRAVRSVAYLLAKFPIRKIYFVAPDIVRMKDDIKEYLQRHHVEFSETDSLLDVVGVVDVIYQTRIQRERFEGRIDDFNAVYGKYVINQETLKHMRKGAIILHPLPRVNEITFDVDTDSRAAYFRQAQYALFMRMALLKTVLS